MADKLITLAYRAEIAAAQAEQSQSDNAVDLALMWQRATTYALLALVQDNRGCSVAISSITSPDGSIPDSVIDRLPTDPPRVPRLRADMGDL